MLHKPENTYRICFENINGLGFDVSHNIKQDRFITWARENDIDAMGWAELNINWRLTTPWKNYVSVSAPDRGVN